MEGLSPLKQRIRVLSLLESLTPQAKEELDLLKNPALWHHFDHEDRKILSKLFLKKGDEEISQKLQGASDSFDAALGLSNYSEDLLLEIVKTWRKAKRTDLANELLEKMVLRNPTFVEAKRWLVFGLLEMARFSKDQEILHRIDLMASKINADAELLLAHGEALLLIADECEEPLEYKRAIDLLQRSERLGCRKKELYLLLAEAFCQLAALMGAPETFLEAEAPLLKAVEQESKFFGGWLRLAGVYRGLYEMGYADEYFERAESAFLTAAKLHGTAPKEETKALWLSWGHMYLNEGRLKRNAEILQSALQKFERAKALFPDDRDVDCFLCDALLAYGFLQEELDPLNAAKERLEELVRRNPSDPAVLLLLGTALMQIGKYFQDDKKLQKAFLPIEQVIAISPNEAEPWHLLALAHLNYGEIVEDPLHLEKAAGCYAKAASFDTKYPFRILNDWGVTLMKLSDMTGDLSYAEAAAEKFERAIGLFSARGTDDEAPVDPEWLHNLGAALDYVGDFRRDPNYYERSVEILTKLVSDFPGYSQARYSLALSLSHFGEAVGEPELLDLSQAHLDYLLKEDPEDEVALCDSAVNLMIMAEIQLDSHNYSEVKETFQEAKERLLRAQALGSHQSLYWLACLFSMQGMSQEALYYLQKAREAGSLPPKPILEEEDWLDSMRELPPYKKWLDGFEI